VVLDDGKKAVIVDPGGEAAAIFEHLAQNGLSIHEIWLTHAHFDHVGALAEVKEAARKDVATSEPPIRMHPADEPILARAAEAAAAWGVSIPQPPTDTVDLVDGENLSFAGCEVTCLHTPGHAPGHIAFWIPAEGIVLAGDALFKGSVGRTDLPFGDRGQLLESIREQLLTLPPDTLVLPGHGPTTDIGTEAASNPFLY
jgi:glyoxylase-like metal-dependent hydrolase (beta-lactamase superfamily II)